MPSLRLKIPPVILCLGIAALMAFASRATPSLRLEFAGRLVLALALTVAGVVIAALGVGRFVRAKTTVHPTHPERASALVTTGIYRRTRNPMYLGLLILLAAWAVYLANPCSLVGLPVFVAYMNRFQIAAEEDALRARFGQAFLDFESRVRRWW